MQGKITQIEQALKSQNSELDEITKLMEQVSTETDSLKTDIMAGVELCRTQASAVDQMSLQIDAMATDLRKNTAYRDQVERIIDVYNSPCEQGIQVPFNFFYELNREQMKELAKL